MSNIMSTNGDPDGRLVQVKLLRKLVYPISATYLWAMAKIEPKSLRLVGKRFTNWAKWNIGILELKSSWLENLQNWLKSFDFFSNHFCLLVQFHIMIVWELYEWNGKYLSSFKYSIIYQDVILYLLVVRDDRDLLQ